MLHETIELSAGRVRPSAGGWRETVERRSKIQCGKGFLAAAIPALMAANPSLSKTQAAGLASAAIAEAVADSSRPANDTARDVNRKPLETLAFAGVRPGDKIADYAALSNEYTSGPFHEGFGKASRTLWLSFMPSASGFGNLRIVFSHSHSTTYIRR
jgi:hypothetical protein